MHRALTQIHWRGWINRMIPNRKNRLLVVGLLSMLGISLTGCTTCANAIPNNEPTMAEIYETAMQQSHQSTLEQAREQVKNITCSDSLACIPSNTKTEMGEVNTIFPTLPNPPLVMYVYPHLSHVDEAPVPGYTTAFSLYEKTYYAVEGELISVFY
jgi:conjugative transfer region lipoprotein (TIGR03751 family)